MDLMQEADGPGCVTATLFARLWETLSDSLGGAAAVALLGRSRRRAAARYPELDAIVVERAGGSYCFRLPERWSVPAPEPSLAFRGWVDELLPFVVELTGAVIVRRLAAIPELRRWRLLA